MGRGAGWAPIGWPLLLWCVASRFVRCDVHHLAVCRTSRRAAAAIALTLRAYHVTHSSPFLAARVAEGTRFGGAAKNIERWLAIAKVGHTSAIAIAAGARAVILIEVQTRVHVPTPRNLLAAVAVEARVARRCCLSTPYRVDLVTAKQSVFRVARGCPKKSERNRERPAKDIRLRHFFYLLVNG